MGNESAPGDEQPFLNDHPLLLVRANRDLHSRWSSNVSALMLYFTHGPDTLETEADIDAVSGTWMPVGRFLADKQVETLCVEVGDTDSGDTTKTATEVFTRLNQLVDVANATGELPDVPLDSGFEIGVVSALAAMLELGARLPRLVPIDRGGTPTSVQTVTPLPSPDLPRLARIAAEDDATLFSRESTVLHQLFAISQEVGADGKLHVIASLQGKYHARTFEAAEALGAHVERYFIDDVEASPLWLMQRILDAHAVGTVGRDTLELLDVAALLAQIIIEVPANAQAFDFLSTFDRELAIRKLDERLGRLCIIGLDSRLPAPTQASFDEMFRLLRTEPSSPAWHTVAAHLFQLCLIEISQEG